MDVTSITILIWFVFLLLLATGMPVAFSMLAIALSGYIVFVGPQALNAIFPVVFDVLTKDFFVAIPLYIFMASILQVSGIGERLYGTMYKWMAGVRGGLAIGTVLISTMIAATSGLVAAGTIITGMLAYPEMRRRGYDKTMAIGPVISGGALGLLIPPSVTMILVGGLGGISTGKLFMSGVVPGLICSLSFILYIVIRCYRNPSLGPALALAERATYREKVISLIGLFPPIFLIVLVLGGIWGGIFTPSEAGGIGAFGALICAALYRELNLKNLWSAVRTTFRANAMVMWLAFTGAAFASLCGITGVTDFISKVLSALPLPTIGIIFVCVGLLLIMGMIIDTLAMTMISVPVMMPIAINLGVDPLYFGLLLVFAITIGTVTPPFGYSIFYFKGLGHADVSTMDVYRASWVFSALMTVVMFLCIIFPELSLWFPSIMVK